MRDEGDISFIARGDDINIFVTSERGERGTKYDIVTRAIKLILPSLECDNLFITYLCLYLGQKSDYIFTLFIQLYFEYISEWMQKLLFRIRQTGRNYKNKPKITYLLIAANFFCYFPCIIVYFVVVFLSILQLALELAAKDRNLHPSRHL